MHTFWLINKDFEMLTQNLWGGGMYEMILFSLDYRGMKIIFSLDYRDMKAIFPLDYRDMKVIFQLDYRDTKVIF